jgi:ATP-dependent Clp protease ATP-binding subunit ClpB
VFDLLKQNMRPEFLNRIDETIMFLPLTRKEIAYIVDIMMEDLKGLLTKQELSIELSGNAKHLLADLGYEPEFGARPLRRVIQKEITNSLSKEILRGTYQAGDTIFIDTDAKGFTFGKK